MGNDTINFKCHHCGHCCTDVVCLPTPWDVRRIEKMTGVPPEDFLEFLEPDEIEEVDMEDPTWLDVDGQPYMMALKRDEVTGCGFLNNDTNFCSIYEARPLLCRLYPFKLEEDENEKYVGFSLHKDVGCPKHQDGVFETGPLYDLSMQDELNQEDYCELVEIFNGKRYENKEPFDFVTLFTSGLLNFDEAVGVEEDENAPV